MSMKSSKAVCEDISSGFIHSQDQAITALADRLEDTTNALAEFGMVLSQTVQRIEARLDALEGRNL